MAKSAVVFNYDNYREYLKDAYAERKARDRAFSFRQFSRVAGFKSPSVLKGVMDGERNIASHSIEKFAKALRLNKEESEFFRNLVLMNQAKTLAEKQEYAELMLKNRKMRELHPLAESQFNYYNRWYFVPVRELVGTKGFKDSPEWIARRVHPEITPIEAARALNDLGRLGLIERDEKGNLRQTTTNVSTGDEVTWTAVTLWHQEMLKKASNSIENISQELRDISAVTVTVTPETIEEVKELIRKFRKEILEVCSRDREPEEVYQLGIQFFPVSGRTRLPGDQ